MRRGRSHFFVLCFVTASLLCASIWAQETTGAISGTVKDPSGAVVPRAKVTISDADKHAVVRTATTGSAGEFAFPQLQFGRYSVTVEAPGFKKYVEDNITLNVNDKLTLSPVLQVGSQTEVVRVEAAADMVATDAVATGVVTGTQVREIPLNNRVWTQIMITEPGVSDSNSTDQYYVGATNPFGGSATNTIGFQVNGGRREENNFLVDGMDNIDRGSNLTLLSFPSVDSISEFRIVRGVYDAELGRSAGAQINVVTRSGTSDLHGGVYEFFRNDKLNANNFFNNRSSVLRPLLRDNNFGGTVGGPVYIPHVYRQRDKTFFFVSEEFRRVITYTNATAIVPTPGMKSGQFGTVVCNSWANVNGAVGPCTGYGTSIPTANISPVAAAYIKDIYSKFPAPNSPTPFNYVSTLRNTNNFREDMIKIDHSFGTKLSLNGKYLNDTVPTIEAGGLFTSYPLDGIATTSTNSPGHQYNIHATYTPSPTFILDGGYGFSYGAILSNVIGSENFSGSPDVQTALTGLPFQNVLGRVPTIGITSGTGVSTFGPYNDYNRNQTVFINATKVWGTHTFKAGFIAYHYNKHENQLSGSNNGSFSFTNTNGPSASVTAAGCGNTGQPACASTFEQSWANFLLGQSSGFSQASIDDTANIFDNQLEYYVQDAWRVKSNLTVTYGFRHSFFREPTDASGPNGTSELSNFDLALYSPSQAPCILANGSIDVTLVNNLPSKSACNPGYSPLNGFIYVNPPTYAGFKGTQSPFGSKVGKEFDGAVAPRIGIAWDPRGDGKTSVRAGFGLFYDNGLEFGNPELNVANTPGFLTNLSFNNVSFANPTGATTTVTSTAAPALNMRVPINYKSPYSEQRSFDIQHQFLRNVFVDVGYYGNNGVHLPGFEDTNAPAPDAWQACAAPNNCKSGPNTIQFTSTGGSLAGGAACNGRPCITSSNTTGLNILRPWVGYAGSSDFEDIYTSNYNSLQAQVQKRFAGASFVSVAYTWSHGLTTDPADRSTGGAAIPQTYTNIEPNNYGPNVADRRHVLTTNFVYELPWMRAQKGFIGHLLGGWELSGLLTFQTGLPITTTLTGANVVDPAGVGCLGSTPCGLRADQVGQADQQGNCVSGVTSCFHTQGAWFNGGPLTSNPAFVCYGTATGCVPYTGQINIGTERPGAARGPGFWRTDLGLLKNIKFSERLGGQFRLETFNTFNHTNPIQPGASLTSTTYNQVLSSRDPRLVQLGMKLNF